MEHTTASFESSRTGKNSSQEEKEIRWLRGRNGSLFDEKDFVPKAGTGSSRTPPHKKDGNRRSGYSG